MEERGIIISPPVKIINGGGLHAESSEISEEQLRFSLLFWDKIDWPDNNIISMGNGDTPDLEFLSQCKIFSRTTVRFNSFSGGAGIALLQMQDTVLKEKNKLNPGMWSIERIGEDLIPVQGVTIQSKAIEFELYNCLPIPHREVPLNDILEFKEKYHSELLTFRCLMDEAYLSIINSPDAELAKRVAITRLSMAISDLHKAMQSKSMARSLLSYKVVLNDFSDMWDTVTRGYGAYELLSGALGNELAGLVGSVNAIFKISAKQQPMSQGLTKELKDYAYLAKIEQELL